MTRADRHNNPAAFTTDLAKQAGLRQGIDYEDGDLFPPPSTLMTAKILGDPIALTIQLINAVGYYTKSGRPRWTYIAIPDFVWAVCPLEVKKQIIHFHYEHEGGTELAHLFQ